MTERLKLLWPQEAHPWPDSGQSYRVRAAERAQLLFEGAPWRTSAVAQASEILERILDAQTVEEQVSSERLVKALHEARLIPALNVTFNELTRSLVFDSLVAEASAALLHRRTDRRVWNMIEELVHDLHGMLPALRATLRTFFRNDEKFKVCFNGLAGAILSDSLTNPATNAGRRGFDSMSALVEHWRRAPDLRSVWSGLPRMRHTAYRSELSVLAHIYLAVDPACLVQFLERFDNPYQIWSVLTGPWGLGLEREFSAWSAVFKHTRPSFGLDGSWTKRTLELLLLVVAQDAIQQARLPQASDDNLVSERQQELNALVGAISGLVAEKTQGSPLALRWSAWLVRATIGSTSSSEEHYPRDLRQATTPLWCMLQALTQSSAAEHWNSIEARDAVPEEVLCLLSAKVLAASEGRSSLPDVEPLLRCLPAKPEDFLGSRGTATRDLVRMYWSYGARPDALKYRVLSLLFFKGDPVASYCDFWRRTLTLRELAEHWQAGDENDGRMEAKEALAMAIAIGINVLDCYADAQTTNNGKLLRTREQFGELFRTVYDALRELRAIELFNEPFWTTAYQHLLVRRALYENARTGDIVVTAPLAPDAEPSVPSMLANIATVAPIFFDALDSLIRNGLSVDAVADIVRSASIDLATYVDSADRLNEMDDRIPYRIEAAAKILAQMKGSETSAPKT